MARRRIAIAAIALGMAVLAAPAAASVGTQLPHLGVIPLGKTARGFAVPKGYQSPNDMTYHGGSVMHTNTTHAIFWQGDAGDPFPANYQSIVGVFLKNVAAASGASSNVYSTDVQYYDKLGNVQYNSTFAGGMTDTDPYPGVGCVSEPVVQQSGTVTFDHCLTDDQLASELDSFISARGLPRGLGQVYLLYLPPRVQTCSTPSSDSPTPSCFGTDYCAYHSGFFETNSSAPVTLFGNLPYAAAIDGCVAIPPTGTFPNDPQVDPTIDVSSHEHNEMITDPLGDAWYSDNQQGGEGEDGDLCNTTYSPTPGRNYNQVIAGHRYFTQGEWSNLDNGCAFGLSAYMPVARIKASHVHVRPHRKLSFDASRSRSPSGSIVSYRWQFGDGKSASGRTVSHTFKHTGKHTVTLTVTDSNHLTGTAKITIIVRKRK